MRCDICIRCVDRRLQSGRIGEHKLTLSLWRYWNRMLLGVWLPVHTCFLWQTINKIFCSSAVPDPLLDNLAAAERIESELTCHVETRGLYWSFQGEFMSAKGGQERFSKKKHNKQHNKNSAAEERVSCSCPQRLAGCSRVMATQICKAQVTKRCIINCFLFSKK